MAHSLISDENFKKLFDSLYEGVWICDKNGVCLYVNSSWLKMFGTKKEQVLGKSAEQLYNEGISTFSTTNKAMAEKKIVHKIITSKTGKNIEQVATPVLDDFGALDKIIIVNRYFNDDLDRDKHKDTIIPDIKEIEENSEMGTLVDDPIPYIAASPPMIHLLDTAKRAAQSGATVMILGESGVGKDGLAYYIHSHSKRQDQPFVIINCATLPPTLIESELFGHERGAFTDATKTHIGLFEQANHGTVFLDEIGDLPLSAQTKLLRCIQNREILRIGGKKTIKLDIQLITATNRPLAHLVETGEFRSDLFYRLNIIKLDVPPLRERKEDILTLTKYFLEKFNAQYGVNKQFSNAVFSLFTNYNWPGNVRELENAVECCVVLCPYVIIGPEFLPDNISHKAVNGSFPTLKEERLRCELELITKVLNSGYSIREASSILKCDHSTIVRKFQKIKRSFNQK